jgi:hypothetical protein
MAIAIHHHPKQTRRRVLFSADTTDARRIVLAKTEPQAFRHTVKPPKLLYNGGPLIEEVNIVSVYWGDQWNTNANLSGYRIGMDQFFDFIVTSPLISQLKEYDAGGYVITNGQHSGSFVITSSMPGASVTDTTIQHMLQSWILSEELPPFDGNTLYTIFLPSDTVVLMGGGASCLSFCGYHDAIQGEIFYAVLPWPGCSGCAGLGGDGDSFKALTVVASHEIAEAITDPIPGQGWYDSVHGEIGDICESQGNIKQLGQYTVQLLWSNSQNSCV